MQNSARQILARSNIGRTEEVAKLIKRKTVLENKHALLKIFPGDGRRRLRSSP